MKGRLCPHLDCGLVTPFGGYSIHRRAHGLLYSLITLLRALREHEKSTDEK